MKRKFTPVKVLFSVLFSLIAMAACAQTATPFSGPSNTTPPPTSASAVQAVICNGNQIVIKSSTTASSYMFYKKTTSGTMLLVQNGTSNTYTETSTGSGYYTYTLVTVNSNGCESPMSDPYNVFVLPPLTPTITASSTNVCASAQTTSVLTASPVSNSSYTYSYQWTRNGVNIAGATSNTYTVSETTAGTVTYDVKVSYNLNPTCAVFAPAQPITVVPLPAKPVIQW
jgi:hypothetical protein